MQSLEVEISLVFQKRHGGQDHHRERRDGGGGGEGIQSERWGGGRSSQGLAAHAEEFNVHSQMCWEFGSQ